MALCLISATDMLLGKQSSLSVVVLMSVSWESSIPLLALCRFSRFMPKTPLGRPCFSLLTRTHEAMFQAQSAPVTSSSMPEALQTSTGANLK